GVDTHLKIRALADRLPPNTSTSHLKTLLAPLIVDSQVEQELFYQFFEQFFHRYDHVPTDRPIPVPAQSTLVAEAPEEQPPTWLRVLSKRRFYLATQLIILGILGMVGVYSIDCFRETRSFRATIECLTGSFVPFDQPISPQVPDSLTRRGGDTIRSLPPDEGKPTPGSLNRTASLDEASILQEDITQYQASWWEQYNPVIKLLLFLAIAGSWLFLEIYRMNRRRYFLMKENRKKGPYYWPLQAEEREEDLILYTEEAFFEASRQLRNREIISSSELDIESSIKETLESGGFPQYRFKQKSKPPEYLVLIQKQSERDHLSMLFDQMILEISKQDIFAERFFFEQDPRLCWSERFGGEIYLEELYRRYPENRLIIIGDSGIYFDPVGDGLCGWINWIKKWRQVAIVSTVNPLDWGRRELEISRQFLLLPSNLEALASLSDLLNQDRQNHLRYWLDQNEYPRIPDLEQAELIPALKRYFDIRQQGESSIYEKGAGYPQFAHLAACALYPELNWDLTLRLGEELAKAHQTDLVSPRRLLALVRLPWFRQGYLPEEVRIALLKSLREEDRKLAQETLIKVLKSQQLPSGSFAESEHQLAIAVQEAQLHNDFSHNVKLIQKVQDYSLNHEIQDQTVIEYLDSLPKSVLKFQLPKGFKQVFFRQGLPTLGLKSWIRAAFALGISCLILLSINDAWTKIRSFRGQSYYLADDYAKMRFFTHVGNEFLKDQQYSAATSAYEQAIQYREEAGLRGDAYLVADYNLALLKWQNGEEELAQAEFAMLSEQSESMIEVADSVIDSKDLELLSQVKSKSNYNTGVIAYRSENLDLAQDAFQRSIKANDRQAEAIYGQAMVLIRKGLDTQGADQVNKLKLALNRLEDVKQADSTFLGKQQDLAPILDSVGTRVYPTSFQKSLNELRSSLGLPAAVVDTSMNTAMVVSVEDEAQLADEVTYISDFQEGLAVVQFEGKYGFIDQKGNLLGIKYADARPFSEGLAAVKSGKSWGYVDKNLREVIPLQYENAGAFSEGNASVKLRGRWGMIDRRQTVLIPFQYDLAFAFEPATQVPEGATRLAAVVQGGKYLYINPKGEEAFPDKRFQWAENFGEQGGKFAKVKRWGTRYYLNRQGACEAALLKDRRCPTEQWEKKLLREIRGHVGPINAVVTAPRGDFLVSAGSDGQVIVWDRMGKNQVAVMDQGSSVRSVAISSDSKVIASGGDDGQAQAWAPDGSLLQSLELGKARIWSVAISPDKKLLGIGSEDRKAYLYDLSSGKELTRFEQHRQAVNTIAFSPSGRQIASGSEDGSVYLWNPAGKLQGKIEVRDQVLSLAFSPNGKTLLIGTKAGVLLWYEVSQSPYRPIKTVGRHQDWIWQVGFSPNGQYFLSASADNTARVWNQAGEEVLRVREPGTVRSVSFSPDGSLLMVASWGPTNSGNNKVSFYQLDIY
ncbi:MAG: WG repeat-containing protein, partial [Bacteroidota bacterium]